MIASPNIWCQCVCELKTQKWLADYKKEDSQEQCICGISSGNVFLSGHPQHIPLQQRDLIEWVFESFQSPRHEWEKMGLSRLVDDSLLHVQLSFSIHKHPKKFDNTFHVFRPWNMVSIEVALSGHKVRTIWGTCYITKVVGIFVWFYPCNCWHAGPS